MLSEKRVTLLDSEMSVDRSVTSSTCEVLSLSVGNMFSVSLDVSLCKSEVDQKDLVTGLVETDAEVIRLNVSVDEVSVVNILNTSDHLVDQHQNCLQGELSECVLEETLQGGAHEIHD